MRKKWIMEAIEDYLSRHPDAADSANGIAWWVAIMGVEASVQEVTDALETLREAGLIDGQCLGGRMIYRAKHSGDQDAEH